MRSPWPLALAFASGLAGCASPVEADLSHVTMAAGPKCSVARIADVPLTPLGPNFTVDARINGRDARLVLDTGAPTLVLNPEAVTALGLEPDRVPRLLVSSGLGGTSTLKMAQADSFELGGFRMHRQVVAVGAMTFGTGQTAADHPAGLLGAGFLQAFDLDLDFAADRMSLYGSRHCDDGFLPWQPPFDSVPLQVLPSGHILVPIVLNGTRMNALLDTGAAVTMVSAKAAATLGITREELARDRQIEVGAVGPNSLTSWVHDFRSLSVGQQEVEGPTLLISSTDFSLAPVLLGLDFLRRYRVWISYASSRLYLTPLEKPGA